MYYFFLDYVLLKEVLNLNFWLLVVMKNYSSISLKIHIKRRYTNSIQNKKKIYFDFFYT